MTPALDQDFDLTIWTHEDALLTVTELLQEMLTDLTWGLQLFWILRHRSAILTVASPEACPDVSVFPLPNHPFKTNILFYSIVSGLWEERGHSNVGLCSPIWRWRFGGWRWSWGRGQFVLCLRGQWPIRGRRGWVVSRWQGLNQALSIRLLLGQSSGEQNQPCFYSRLA